MTPPRTVDVLPQLRTAAFDRVLTYLVPEGMSLRIGDVVRAPLGSRDVYGYVVSPEERAPGVGGLRPIAQRVDGPPAFDATGLALARFMAERYCCSLGEALGAVVLAGSIPRAVERLLPGARPSDASMPPSVPHRLAALIWDDLADGFSLDQLLRHPEARRAGDRRALRGAVGALVKAGALQRVRTFEGPRLREARERVLEATGASAHGRRAEALVALVREAGTVRRSDALLAGYSSAVIARAVRAGALVESERRPSPAAGGSGRGLELTPTLEQRAALEVLAAALGAGRFSEVLIQGVTGSGKTFVYLSAIARVLSEGGRAIVLVPEISLTPQTARRFEAAFGDRVAVLHSGLSERDRFESWRAAARGEIDVVVGARSAVFAPLRNVRIVVVDEAHERSYKQDAAPRYSALDVARERMRLAAGVVALGSATPPLEAYAAVQGGDVRRVVLSARATASALPAVHVVDMAQEFGGGNRRIFSSSLVDALGRRLACGEKTVLFVNRRGSASFVLCRACGHVPECTRCSVSLTAHRAEGLLRCHLCDAQRPLVAACPRCGAGPIREFGVGTQKVAETVAALFPAARLVRMDSDSTTRVGDHARLLDEFADRGDVLVGTQMIAKGLDFPTVTLVGVVAADIGLHAADFRASERTFDLLTQVAGRSGRTSPGEAIVQTYAPDHPAVRFAAHHDYEGFARWELAARRELRYPPYAELVYLGVIGRRLPDVIAAAGGYASALRALRGAEVLGPAPYAILRVNDEFRYRIAVKTADGPRVRAFIRDRVQSAARGDRTTRLAVNVDP